MRERKPFYQRYRRQLRCKRSGMRNMNESRTGLATIRGTPRVATPHNLQFVLTPTPRALPPYVLRGSQSDEEKTKTGREIFLVTGTLYLSTYTSFPDSWDFIRKMFLNGSLYCFARLFFIIGFFNAISGAIKGNDYQRYHQQVRNILINIHNNWWENICIYILIFFSEVIFNQILSFIFIKFL